MTIHIRLLCNHEVIYIQDRAYTSAHFVGIYVYFFLVHKSKDILRDTD